MPFFKDKMSYGNLFVKFEVVFPKRGELKENQLNALKDVIF
jgi:DnaJ-class molecular chaperone